ncbi:MAG: metallophosphoesterase [Deltaproteobacteria bacterium]|nr:metallophosphoesterase [Deltaproteobacteria bacterium]
MFLYFSVILTGYVFLSYLLRLPVSRTVKFGLVVLTFASAGRIMIMRSIYGGLGGIEAPKWLLFFSSFMQDLIIMLFLVSIIRDLSWLLSFLAGKGIGKTMRVWLNGSTAALVMLGLAAAMDLAGLVGAARVPNVRERMVTIEDWPEGLDGLRVAVLADMHISRFFDRPWVEQVVERTMAERPEMILLPGDMVDGETDLRADDVAPLAALSAPYGVWASVGNHEYISRLQQWLPVFEKLGLKILYNAHAVATPRGIPIVVAGLADLTALSSRFDMPGPDLALALKGAPEDVPVLLMEHRPVRAKENALNPGIKLQLSGHTHGGMMPVLASFIKRANDGYVCGEYDVDGLKLFVQPGLGLWSGFPVRLFTPNEITILTIHAAGDGHAGV